jgi:hypothetical protein
MTKDEALKMALEALESCDQVYGSEGSYQYFSQAKVDKAITAIKQALAAPVQKMVANMTVEDGRISFAARILADGTYDLYTTPIYAVPFQRKSLTEEDILECWKQAYEPGRREHDNAIRMARAIEAKLKERTQ